VQPLEVDTTTLERAGLTAGGDQLGELAHVGARDGFG
jgi:hypothetical protein